MSATRLERLLDQLDDAKRRFGRGQGKQTERLLQRVSRLNFKDAESLIRFHEILLFLRAYPPSAAVLRVAERELSTFSKRVELLTKAGYDTGALMDPEVSGIAGTSVTDTFSYYIVRWLQTRHPSQVTFDWNWFEDENRLAETWPRFMPLLEEDATVEANVPYREWLRAAKGRSREVAWLIRRFESLKLSDKEKAELHDSLKLYVRWTPSDHDTRTGMKLPIRNVFFHQKPLIRRQDFSFRDEVESTPPPINRLSIKQGEAILDMTRETSTMRYRELYGFTHGDPAKVFKASPGRGVDIFLVDLPPGRRLPLRAYHAAMIFKNGVPAGYFEGLSLFERMESGFNLYYSFRDGETAWIYARTLNLYRHLLGSTVFVLDPYQLGHENEEGIDSGAFWFYRKLGFRPAAPQLLKRTLDEEEKIAARSAYRTPKTLLRKLAASPMVLELDGSKTGDWDSFQVRNIGLAVQRRMATRFAGNAEKCRQESLRRVCQVLSVKREALRSSELGVWSDFAVMLDLIPDLQRWSRQERRALVQIIRAKAAADESRYLKLMQRHERLRREMIKIGSAV